MRRIEGRLCMHFLLGKRGGEGEGERRGREKRDDLARIHRERARQKSGRDALHGGNRRFSRGTNKIIPVQRRGGRGASNMVKKEKKRIGRGPENAEAKGGPGDCTANPKPRRKTEVVYRTPLLNRFISRLSGKGSGTLEKKLAL